MESPLGSVPRTSFRLPFGIGFTDPLKADAYDSENIAVGRTTPGASPAAVYLGKLAEFEQMRRNIWLDTRGAHALYIVGKRRSGKSYTLGVVCEGLVAQSWLRLGPPDQAVLLIDTLNIYGTLHVPTAMADGTSDERRLWQLPSELPTIRYVAPEATRSMIPAPSIPLTVDPAWLTLEDWCNFFDVDPFADPMGHLLGILVESVKARWAHQDKVANVSKPSSGVEDLLNTLDSNSDALHFEDSTRQALRRRLLAVDRLGFLARPSPRVEKLLSPGTITVCQLRDWDDRLRALVVAVLVREIIRARGRADAVARRAAAQQRLSADSTTQDLVDHGEQPALDLLPRCWIAIDEAHNYLPTSGTIPSRPVLRRLITEGRNIGLSAVVATQQPSGLDTSIQRNADALIVHSMSMREDILAAESMLNTTVPDSVTWGAGERVTGKIFEKLVRSLPQGYCLLSSDSANRVFGVRIRPRLSMHGGESY